MKFLLSYSFLFVLYDTLHRCSAGDSPIDATSLLQVETRVKYILDDKTAPFLGINSACITVEMVNSTSPYLAIVDYMVESKWNTLVYTGTPSSSPSSHQPALIYFTTSESDASVEYQTHELLQFERSACFVLSGVSRQDRVFDFSHIQP
ncbi:uncharacterized protein [Dermacentor andersoni]|uniref:uncharacterized protein n=1 Tax=Dermacentor andersoni TaxID=34620 RepID=UPI002416C8DB|nr:uncharacterized protein LOC126522422 isoform X2 [Dermacentor andersoni]